MKKTNFKNTISIFFFLLSLICIDTNVTAQFRTDPGNVVAADNNINGTIYRNARISVGGFAPAGLPTDTRLHVGGRFSQEFSGNIGGFNTNDRWASLGESFSPVGTVPKIYGLIRTWGGTSYISGVKEQSNIISVDLSLSTGINTGIDAAPSPGPVPIPLFSRHGVVAWSGSNSRLDFDWISGGSSSTAFTRMSISPGGNVAIGSFASNFSSFRFFVNGATGCTLGAWSGSDKRYKENISTVENALDKVMALEGVTYNFKNKEINGFDFGKSKGEKYMGFIAQDLEKVLPAAVRTDENGYYTVNYDGVTPVVVEAIKEQQIIIKDQQKLIDRQESEITSLEERLNRLETLVTQLAQGNNAYDKSSSIRSTAVLEQNVPNPSRGNTRIAYELPSDIANADLVIYDLNGKVIQSFPIFGEGSIDFDVSGLANGTYVYTINSNGEIIARQKMLIQK